MIKLFVFDIEGVLVQTADKIKREIIARGFDREKLARIWGDGDIAHQFYIGKINFEEYQNEVKALFPNDYISIIHDYFEYSTNQLLYWDSKKLKENVIDPYAITFDRNLLEKGERILSRDVVKELHNHYELAILSGNVKERLDLIDGNFDIFKYFTYPIISYKEGTLKPNKDFYQILLDRIPYPAAECIYFDDAAKFVAVGLEMGLKAMNADQVL